MNVCNRRFLLPRYGERLARGRICGRFCLVLDCYLFVSINVMDEFFMRWIEFLQQQGDVSQIFNFVANVAACIDFHFVMGL